VLSESDRDVIESKREIYRAHPACTCPAGAAGSRGDHGRPAHRRGLAHAGAACGG
jgi:hypothetical protein